MLLVAHELPSSCALPPVEHDIRDVNVTLDTVDTVDIRAKSVDLLHKELLTSIVAYNLVVQFRRQAAKLAAQFKRQIQAHDDADSRSAAGLVAAPCPRAAPWPVNELGLWG